MLQYVDDIKTKLDEAENELHENDYLAVLEEIQAEIEARLSS